MLADAYPTPTSQFYVYDDANVLDADTEDYIVQTNAALSDATGAQILQTFFLYIRDYDNWL